MNRVAAFTFSAAVSLSLTFASAAVADDFMLDYAAVVGAGKQVTMTRVPVVAANGAVTYKDVTVLFALGTGNTLVMAPGYPKTVNSPALQTGNFTPGKYYYQLGTTTKVVVQLSGPSVGPNKRATWTLSSLDGTVSMAFYVGPVYGHPMQARLQKAGIKETGGALGQSSSSYDKWTPQHRFNSPAIVALIATGEDLNIESYTTTDSNPEDYPMPIATLVLRKCKAAICG